MTLTNKQTRTRLDLIRTMESLLSRQKFEDITINDICEEALLTRTTFYRYFVDKYALTEAMLEYIGNRDFRYDQATTFLEGLTAFIKRNQSIIQNLNPYNQQRLNFYNEFTKIIENALTSYVTQNQNAQGDLFVSVITKAPDQQKMVAFIAGGAVAILMNDNSAVNYQTSIKFLSTVLEQLAK